MVGIFSELNISTYKLAVELKQLISSDLARWILNPWFGFPSIWSTMEGNGSLVRVETENQLWLQFRRVVEQVSSFIFNFYFLSDENKSSVVWLSTEQVSSFIGHEVWVGQENLNIWRNGQSSDSVSNIVNELSKILLQWWSEKEIM